MAEPGRVAIIHVDDAGDAHELTYGEMREHSNRLANLLSALDIERGDRVGILLPQCPQTAIAHIAALKLGAITIPLFMLFGGEALQHRLANSGARAVITDRAGVAKLLPLLQSLPALASLISIDGGEGAIDLGPALREQSDAFAAVETRADDPAFIIYTSGTTGPSKGALHAHRVLAWSSARRGDPQTCSRRPGDRLWTPADWAWIGGLLDVFLPAFIAASPVVAHRSRNSPEAAFGLIDGMASAIPSCRRRRSRYAPGPARSERRWALGCGRGQRWRDIRRRAARIGSRDPRRHHQRVLRPDGVPHHRVEPARCLMSRRPGSMGKPVPGHRVEVIDDNGRPCAVGETGVIAIAAAGPGDDARLLEQSRARRAAKFRSATGWSRR